MRNYMQLLENVEKNDVVDDEPTMGEPLEGTFVDPSNVIKYFPSVEDEQAFKRAWRKILRNQEERLLRNEMFEIARAFCDIIRMSREKKMAFIRKIQNVEVSDEQSDEIAHTIYR